MVVYLPFEVFGDVSPEEFERLLTDCMVVDFQGCNEEVGCCENQPPFFVYLAPDYSQYTMKSEGPLPSLRKTHHS